MKTKRTPIEILSDVLVAVASLDLKVPITTSRTLINIELFHIFLLLMSKV